MKIIVSLEWESRPLPWGVTWLIGRFRVEEASGKKKCFFVSLGIPKISCHWATLKRINLILNAKIFQGFNNEVFSITQLTNVSVYCVLKLSKHVSKNVENETLIFFLHTITSKLHLSHISIVWKQSIVKEGKISIRVKLACFTIQNCVF